MKTLLLLLALQLACTTAVRVNTRTFNRKLLNKRDAKDAKTLSAQSVKQTTAGDKLFQKAKKLGGKPWYGCLDVKDQKCKKDIKSSLFGNTGVGNYDNINALTSDGNTPLMQTLRKFEDKPNDEKPEDEAKWNESMQGALRVLIGAGGADVNKPQETTAGHYMRDYITREMSPLEAAVVNGKAEEITILLAAGADVDVMGSLDIDGAKCDKPPCQPVLHTAASLCQDSPNNFSVLKQLIEAGADVSATFDNDSAVDRARTGSTRKNRVPCEKLLDDAVEGKQDQMISGSPVCCKQTRNFSDEPSEDSYVWTSRKDCAQFNYVPQGSTQVGDFNSGKVVGAVHTLPDETKMENEAECQKDFKKKEE